MKEGSSEGYLNPGAIAAGCDMFLFTRHPDDDYNSMMEGYNNVVITNDRLDEALTRILALKASLKLNNKSLHELVPDKFWFLNLAEHRRIGIMYNGNRPPNDLLYRTIPGIKGFLMKTLLSLFFKRKKSPRPYEELMGRLNVRGFEASYCSFKDILSVRAAVDKPLDEWTSQFDAIIFLAKWEVMSNQTSLQLQYKAMGFDTLWFAGEVPTILVSLANPYHGYDLSMVKTVINAYSSTPEVYDAVAAKLTGESAFKGVSPVELEFKEPEIVIARK